MVYDFTAIDFETTGLSSNDDAITEIAAIRYRNGRIVAEFVTLVDPRRKIPEFIAKKTGITDEMVKGQPTIEAVIEALCEFIGDDLLVAHNYDFDGGFLNANTERILGRKLNNPSVCTLKFSGEHVPEIKYHGLQDVCNYMGVFRSKAHRAREDAIACAEVYMRIKRKIETGTDVRIPLSELEAVALN